jgi:DNA-binding transcriptional regulator GbsR (MarR family)
LKNPDISIASEARARLVDAGGRTTQDLGLGRIVGQILVYLYLTDGDCSLDKIGEDLELSKASVSIAARQIEKLGLIKRTWKKGDRKSYYRTADNIETALKNGLMSFVLQKLDTVGMELDQANKVLSAAIVESGEDPETLFVRRRVERAKSLRDAVLTILNNPILNAFVQ